MSNYWIGLLLVGFIATCVLLVLAILVQKPQGGGLAGAFGSGAGSGQTAFGTKTGDALTWMTIIVFTLYIAAAIGMNYAARPPVAPAPVVETAEGAPQPAPKPGETPPPATVPTPVNPATPAPMTVPVTPPPANPTTTPTTPPTTTPAPVNPTPTPAPAPAPAPGTPR